MAGTTHALWHCGVIAELAILALPDADGVLVSELPTLLKLISRRTCLSLSLGLGLALGAGTLAVQAQPAGDAALQAVLQGAHRSAANVARDAWRHPAETLSFFGLRPDQVVVELSPGAGWYTEILAPYLRERGQLLLGANDPVGPSEYGRRAASRLQQKLAAQPALYDRVQLRVFEPAAGQLAYAQPASVDLVLTFRNVHNWLALGEDKTQAVFESAFRVLKPGGVLGVVEHRRPAGQPQDAKASSGYVHEATVIALAQQAGFKLAGRSEVNANPRDSADHAGGVWALPPTLANKEQDRERYQAIGESDRMTLKFVKP
jgi:predicted methyltransferase